MNRLYRVIEEDPVLKKDIKMLSIGIGDNPKQIAVYKKKFRVPFPMLTDEHGEIWMALGKPGTPTMVVCTPKGKVLAVHLGVIKDLDAFIGEIRELHKEL